MKTKFYGNQFVNSYWIKAKILGKRVAIVVVLLDAIGWSMTGAYYYAKATIKPETVKAEVRVEVPVESVSPVMERIAKCESGSTHTKNGQVLVHINDNGTYDSGKFQINSIWNKKATDLGFNLSVEKDNEAFAMWLYKNYGTSPWDSSRAKCWMK